MSEEDITKDTEESSTEDIDIYFSQSRLTLALNCFGKYYFKYKQNIKLPSTIWPATLFGKVNHKVIENFLNELKNSEAFKKEVLKIQNNNTSKLINSYLEDNFQKSYQEYFEEINDKSNEKEKFRASRDFNKTRDLKDGSKWSVKTNNFIIRYAALSENSIAEQKFTDIVIGPRGKKIKTTAYVDLIPDRQKHHIYDFKNTKKPQKYFFVDWDNDLQSVIYLYLYYKTFNQFPEQFGYLVFSFQEEMILATSRRVIENEFQFITDMYNKSISRIEKVHEICEDTSLWFAEKDKCRWCEFNKKKWCEKGFNLLKKK